MPDFPIHLGTDCGEQVSHGVLQDVPGAIDLHVVSGSGLVTRIGIDHAEIIGVGQVRLDTSHCPSWALDVLVHIQPYDGLAHIEHSWHDGALRWTLDLVF